VNNISAADAATFRQLLECFSRDVTIAESSKLQELSALHALEYIKRSYEVASDKPKPSNLGDILSLNTPLNDAVVAAIVAEIQNSETRVLLDKV
jgi:hypothetical protein